MCARTDGIWKFLIEDGAVSWFVKTQVWLEQIRAKKACAYLNATARVFPRGRIPQDDDERADLLLESPQISAKLRKADQAYQGSMEEMAKCFRAYIRENFEMFRSELEDKTNRLA